MNCPKCESEMEKVSYEGIEVDRCTNCGGIWFELLEAEKLEKLEGSEAVDAGNAKLGKAYNLMDRIDCPLCKTQMIRMVDPGQHHIWFEGCTVCHGTFFDAGEFKDLKHVTVMDVVKNLLTGQRK